MHLNLNSTSFKSWQILKKNSIVDIIAPAGGIADTLIIEKSKKFLENWQLIPRVSSNLFGSDLLCANNDEQRFQQLQEALFNTDSQAIWCLRGGYGCTRLIPDLLKLIIPEQCKLFIGFSDITALHLFLQQKWHWRTLHAPSLNQVIHHLIEEENSHELKKIIFGQLPQLNYCLKPYFKFDKSPDSIQSSLTGGSLSVVQASLATDWQIETKDKILFLEDVNEPAYCIDRMLQHLHQSGIFNDVNALLLGDFTFSSAQEEGKIQAVLKRFAIEQNFPVLRCPHVGHGKNNRSVPFGAPAHLDLNKNLLTIKITG